MRLPMTLWIISSLLTNCATIPKPNTDLCVVNAPLERQKCYNIKRDYSDEGELKPGAIAIYKPAATVNDLNKNICTDPDGWAELKAYIKKLRTEFESCGKKPE